MIRTRWQLGTNDQKESWSPERQWCWAQLLDWTVRLMRTFRSLGLLPYETPATAETQQEWEWILEERWAKRRIKLQVVYQTVTENRDESQGVGRGGRGGGWGGAVVSKMTYLRRYGEEKECGFFWLGFLLKSFSKCGACLLQGEPQHFRKAWKEIK